MLVIKNKKGALAQIIVAILLVGIGIYLVSNYRVGIGTPTNNLIRSGNEQILEMDKSINKK